MGGNPSPPPPPNYAPIAAAQTHQANVSANLQRAAMAQNQRMFNVQHHLARRQNEYYRDLAERGLARQESMDDFFQQLVADAQARQELLDEQAAEDRAYYEDVFRPLERGLAREATQAERRYERQFSDEDVQRRAASQAQGATAAVAQQYKLARAAAQDRLESFGIDPSQTRSAALDRNARLDQAKAAAGAFNTTYRGALTAEQARANQERAYADALRSEALNVGRGLAGGSMQALQAALANQGVAGQLGGQGASASLAALQNAAALGQQGYANIANNTTAWSQAMGSPVQWAGLAQSGLTGAANTMNTGYRNAVDLYKAMQDQSSGWGSALGLIGGLGATAVMPGLQSSLTPIVSGWFAEGGEVEGLGGGDGVSHQGVPVRASASPSGGKAVDDVPARLNVGEFVVPKDAVMWHGEKTFHQLIEKARQAKQEVTAKPQVTAMPVEPPVVDTRPMPPPPPPPTMMDLGPTTMAAARMSRGGAVPLY